MLSFRSERAGFLWCAPSARRPVEWRNLSSIKDFGCGRKDPSVLPPKKRAAPQLHRGAPISYSKRLTSLFYHFALTRYFSTLVPFALTGTSNCAAHAAVFVYLYVELTISQSPPIGSFTCTVTGASL